MSRFILVSPIMEAILREQRIAARRDKLKEMESALSGVYDRMLSRVKAQGEIKEKIGVAALMWVLHSERPLRVDELCHALAVEIGSADLDPENVPSMGTLLSCCQGLLVVAEETSTVRLIHSTLQNYLSARPDLFDRAHSTIAETCLTYLKFQRFKGPPISDPIRSPFLGYSSIHWGTHAKRELSDCAKSLALELFDDYDEHISIQLLLKDVLGPDHFSDIRGFSSFTGLHCACFFGIVEVVAALMEMNCCSVDQRDCLGNTPLMWAAVNGHKGVVNLLQEQKNVTRNTPCGSSLTPPSHATSYKRKRVEELPPSVESSAPKSSRRPRTE